ALGIAPGAEILDVKVADGQGFRRRSQVRAYLGPELRPAVESRAEKQERALAHALMLEVEILLDERNPVEEPGFEPACSDGDLHDPAASLGVSSHWSAPCGSRAETSTSIRSSAPFLKSMASSGTPRR